MTFQKDTADLFIPDGTGLPDALARTTHLGIGAHQDDLEFMAYQGILECFRNQKKWFSGVVCTNGAGSSRTGPYADSTDSWRSWTFPARKSGNPTPDSWRI
jgi:hypothetical protein